MKWLEFGELNGPFMKVNCYIANTHPLNIFEIMNIFVS